jgi:hypothetical protein
MTASWEPSRRAAFLPDFRRGVTAFVEQERLQVSYSNALDGILPRWIR